LYSHFSTSPGYETTAVLFGGFNPEEIEAIKEVCRKHDMEGTPTMASDILNFTRSNSGGIVSGTAIQQQCGALNALELIINFEWDLYGSLEGNKKVADLIKKMLVVDIVNFADNFFTRQDLAPTDPQYFIGLDDLLSNDFKEPLSIIGDFKKTYRLQENLDKIRLVRNKFCCHIDGVLSISDLQIQLDNLSIEALKRFYSTLSFLYEKVCRSDIRLGVYLVKNDEIKDAVEMVGINAKLFSSEDAMRKVRPLKHFDYNNESLYDYYLTILETDPKNEEALTYICYAIIHSEKIIDERIEVKTHQLSSSYDYFVYRKAQKYLIEILNNPETPAKRKFVIISALSTFGTSTENTYIILKTYDSNKDNKALLEKYIEFLGEKIHERDLIVLNILEKASESDDYFIKYLSLLAIFKIDVKTRVRVIGQENSVESIQSTFIKNSIEAIEDPLHRLGLIAGFSSELSNNRGLVHVNKFIQKVYREPFYAMFDRAFDDLLVTVRCPAFSAEIKASIIKWFKEHNYTVALGKIAEHLMVNGREDAAQLIFSLFMEGYVKINWEHETSAVNFAVFHYRGGKKEYAIKLMEWLIDRNPHLLDLYNVYLSLLKGYDDKKFKKMKQYLIENHKLSPEELKSIEEF
jgi:hypothetical protein